MKQDVMADLHNLLIILLFVGYIKFEESENPASGKNYGIYVPDIICKKFYVSRLFEELGIVGNTSDTYELTTKLKYDIITNNLSL